jgi:type I restriction enzyme M protein
MLESQQQQTIRDAVWRVFEVTRGRAEISTLHNHFLALLLLKYLSDVAKNTHLYEECEWIVTKDSDFHTLLQYRDGIGDEINRAFAKLEQDNSLLSDVFQGIDFNSTAFGSPEQKRRVLAQLLHSFDVAAFDFHEPRLAREAVAFAADSFISQLAAASGKQGGEFFTPPELSQLIARLVRPEPGESICDPCCGSGTLLLTCGEFARENSGRNGCDLYGQEKNGSTWAMAKINLALHDQPLAQLKWGDTLRDPRLIVDGRLQKFNVVVSSPPFNLKDWGHESAEQDAYDRYRRGMPPRSTGDYAFISHMVETLHPDNGRMAVVVALGVLFRSGAEKQIREQLLKENLIDAVIALPAKMFPHTGISVALLVLRKKRADNRVLFIDASHDYQHGKVQNSLREEDIVRIEHTYLARQDSDRYARVVSLDEILKNDCNLSVTRYVDASEEVETVDLAKLRAERAKLMIELESLQTKLSALLQEVTNG